MTQDNSSAQLLPCPFCGGQMESSHGAFGHIGGQPTCPIYYAAFDDAEAGDWNTRPQPSTSSVEAVARALAADIMAAMRRARLPKEYADEAHDEFEALTLVPMLLAALPSPEREPLREALANARAYVALGSIYARKLGEMEVVREAGEMLAEIDALLAPAPSTIGRSDMTAEREALAREILGRHQNYEGPPDPIMVRRENALAAIVEALANPATRGTDEDAELVDALIRAARDVEWEAHFGAKWDARRATMLRARERVLSRLASSTPAEPREASGYCPFCMTADPVAPAEPDEPTAEGNYDERN